MPKRNGKSRGKKTKSKTSKTVSSSIKDYVKKTISRTNETKVNAPYSISNTPLAPYGYAGVTATGTIFNLTTALNVSQGASQGARIGNRIKAKKLTLKGYVNMPGNGSIGSNISPIFLKMFIGREKNTLAAPSNLVNLYNNGPSTTSPTLTPIDMVRSINRDYYNIYKTKVFKLVSENYTSYVTAPSFQVMRRFSIDLSKHVNNLKYDDNTATPTNVAFYMWFVMCHYDGSPITVATIATIPDVEIHFDALLTYEDS